MCRGRNIQIINKEMITMSFKEIIGNEKAKQTLTNAIKNKNILHSYMFSGPEGVGKKELAKEFSKIILCLEDKNESCNNCKSCIEFEDNNNPDFTIIESERKNKNRTNKSNARKNI